jgi:hypothetical protein
MGRSDFYKFLDKLSPKSKANSPWWIWCRAFEDKDGTVYLKLARKPKREEVNGQNFISSKCSNWAEAVNKALRFYGKDFSFVFKEIL